jgi:hypothetical protein
MIAFACPQCGNRLQADEKLTGKTGHCPTCNRLMTVPAARPADRPADQDWCAIVNAPRLPAGWGTAGDRSHARPAVGQGQVRPPRPRRRSTWQDPAVRLWTLVCAGGGLVVGLVLGGVLGFVLRGSPDFRPAADARAPAARSAVPEAPRESPDRAGPRPAPADKSKGKKPSAEKATGPVTPPAKEKEADGEGPAPTPKPAPLIRTSVMAFVVGVEREDAEVLLLLRSEGSTLANYHCYFDLKQAGALGQLKKGQPVRVRGLRDSRDLVTVLTECELVQ